MLGRPFYVRLDGGDPLSLPERYPERYLRRKKLRSMAPRWACALRIASRVRLSDVASNIVCLLLGVGMS